MQVRIEELVGEIERISKANFGIYILMIVEMQNTNNSHIHNNNNLDT